MLYHKVHMSFLDFNIECSEQSGCPVVKMSGEVDIHTYTDMMKTLQSYIEKPESSVVLNILNVDYIDSTGLGAIAKCAHHMDKNNGLIYVVCNKPQILKLFDICGLTKKNVSMFETEALAVKAFGDQFKPSNG